MALRRVFARGELQGPAEPGGGQGLRLGVSAELIGETRPTSLASPDESGDPGGHAYLWSVGFAGLDAGDWIGALEDHAAVLVQLGIRDAGAPFGVREISAELEPPPALPGWSLFRFTYPKGWRAWGLEWRVDKALLHTHGTRLAGRARLGFLDTPEDGRRTPDDAAIELFLRVVLRLRGTPGSIVSWPDDERGQRSSWLALRPRSSERERPAEPEEQGED